jgi:hypothetical protein
MIDDAAHRSVLRLPGRRDAGDLRAGGLARSLACALTVALLLLLAGCGQLPQPFKPATKGDNPLLLLPDRYGIAVAEPSGDVPGEPMALAKAMAKALRDQNVTASVASANLKARWLLADVEAKRFNETVDELRVTWELYDPGGELAGRHEQRARVHPETWAAGDPDVLGRLARAAAPSIAAMVQGAESRQSALPGYPDGTRIVVAPVVGQPGTAARALARAMAQRLRERGLPVADHTQEGDIVIEGRLDIGAANGMTRPVEIVWVLRRHGDDAEMGDLRQANRVPQAQIDEGWNPLADAIAAAALPGVLDVLRAKSDGS